MDGTPQCPNCERLESLVGKLQRQIEKQSKQIAEQAKQIEELQKKLDEQTRSKKRQAAPFRRRKKKSQPKKPGRKDGHPPAMRSVPERVDQIIDVPVRDCPDCGVALINKQSVVQYQTDIPPVQPTVKQFNVEVGECPCCHRRVEGQHEERTSGARGAANHSIGPRAKAMAAAWKYRLGIPFRKISEIFSDCFGLTFTAGGICRALEHLSERHGRPVYDVLQMQLGNSRVVHGDETGWRQAGESRWLHLFATSRTTLFTIRDSRGRDVPLDILGEDFQGVLCCDGWVAYDPFSTARCNGHILQRIGKLLETGPASRRESLEVIKAIVQNGIALGSRRETLTERGYQRLVTRQKRSFASWIDEHGDHSDDEVARLARHLGKYEKQFQIHLDREDIPPTNNFAEQQIRFAVVVRKIGAGNKTDRGAQTFETLASLLSTFRKRSKDFTDWVFNASRLHHPKTIPPDLLPDEFPLTITYQ